MGNKILLYDNGQPFDLDTIYHEPLGGSETSFLLLAKGLSEIDSSNQCVLLTNKKMSKTSTGKIILDNSGFFNDYASQADIIIINRAIPSTIDLFKNKKLFYYAHDAYDQPLIQWMTVKNNLFFFSKIFCVSEWQKYTFNSYFATDNKQMKVIGNSIDYSMTYGFAQRNHNKLIFAGIPYKGIDYLKPIFDDVCIHSKRDDLELHVFSSMELYGQNDQDDKYGQYFSDLSRTKNVYLHKPVSMKELIYHLKTSSIYIAPNLYHETFGINLLLAQACGCLPVTTNKGAVNEIILNNHTGFITQQPNIENNTTYNEYIDLITHVLSKKDDELYKLRLNSINHAKYWNYINVANKVMEEL